MSLSQMSVHCPAWSSLLLPAQDHLPSSVLGPTGSGYRVVDLNFEREQKWQRLANQCHATWKHHVELATAARTKCSDTAKTSNSTDANECLARVSLRASLYRSQWNRGCQSLSAPKMV